MGEYSTSQITCHKKCKKQWFYRFLLMLDSLGFKKNLELGSYVHHLLDEFYLPSDMSIRCELIDAATLQVVIQSRYEWVLTASQKYFDEKTKDLFEEEMQKYFDMRDEAEAIVTRYISNNAEDLLKFSILATEQEFCIPVYNPKGKPTKDQFRGKFDMIVMDEFDSTWFYEHKTTALSVDNRFEDVDLEIQLNNYFMVASKMYEDFAGGVLNVIRKKAPRIPEPLKSGKSLSVDKKIDTTYELYLEAIEKYGFKKEDYTEILNILKEKGDRFFGRMIVSRSQAQLDETRNEIFYAIKQIKADVKAFEKSKDESIFFRCPDMFCKNCSYFNLCILDSKKGDIKDYITSNFTKRLAMNPELSVKEKE